MKMGWKCWKWGVGGQRGAQPQPCSPHSHPEGQGAPRGPAGASTGATKWIGEEAPIGPGSLNPTLMTPLTPYFFLIKGVSDLHLFPGTAPSLQATGFTYASFPPRCTRAVFDAVPLQPESCHSPDTEVQLCPAPSEMLRVEGNS